MTPGSHGANLNLNALASTSSLVPPPPPSHHQQLHHSSASATPTGSAKTNQISNGPGSNVDAQADDKSASALFFLVFSETLGTESTFVIIL